MRVEDLVGSLQTFETNFRQPQRNKSIAFNSIKDSVNEASDSDSEMSPEDMAILVKKFKKFFKKKQEGQSSSVDKNKGKYFDKTKFVRKSSDKSSQKQCFECHGFGHIAIDCSNRKKNKGNKVLTVTWSDSEKEEESDKEDSYENFTAFTASASELFVASSKPQEIEKSDESDDTMGSLKEEEGESDDEDKSELQLAYDQLYQQYYRLTKVNVKLGTKLKKVVDEVEVLKKENIDAQAEVSQLKTHRLTLSDKVKLFEKDAYNREEFKKALEEKVKKLETELANAHLSFKKFDAGSQKIDEIWNAQRISFDMTRIGYTKKATTSSQPANKPNSTKGSW